MRWHKSIVCILAMMMISIFPERSFAASTSHVTKVVTVGEASTLDNTEHGRSVPELVIELKDGLKAGDTFYLNLNHAQWLEAVIEAQIKDQEGQVLQEGANLQVKKLTSTQLEIKVLENDIPKDYSIIIPMISKIESGEATISIDSNNTMITESNVVFAKTSTEKGKVSIGEVPKVAKAGMIAPIRIEESYVGQFKSDIDKGSGKTFTVSMTTPGMKWQLPDDESAKLVGEKGYEGMTAESIRQLSDQVLEVTIPEEAIKEYPLGKGAFKLTGLSIVSEERNTSQGEVKVEIAGDLVENHQAVVLEIEEYGVELEVKSEETSLAGHQHEVSFTLAERLADSISRERSMEFIFSNGVSMPVNAEGKVEVELNEKIFEMPAIKENNRIVGFEIPKFDMEEVKGKLIHSFKVKINIPSTITGDIRLSIEGRGLSEKIDEKIVSIRPAVKVDIEPFTVKSGRKDQVGGVITLTESQANSLRQGEKIFLQIETAGMTVDKLPIVEVIEGDIVLSEAKLVDGGIEIEVVKKSNQPSRIEIKHFNLTVNGAVPDGRYSVAIGGPAISELSASKMENSFTYESIDPVKVEYLILVNMGPKDLRRITFRMGEEAYAIDGKYYHLDVPPYMQNNRTMVPVKYVAEALGIPNEKVKWNSETQKITIYGKKIIELEVDSTIMKVDGEKVYMSAPAALVGGRTMVPIGEIARALDVKVEWNSKTQTATFISEQ